MKWKIRECEGDMAELCSFRMSDETLHSSPHQPRLSFLLMFRQLCVCHSGEEDPAWSGDRFHCEFEGHLFDDDE